MRNGGEATEGKRAPAEALEASSALVFGLVGHFFLCRFFSFSGWRFDPGEKVVLWCSLPCLLRSFLFGCRRG